MYYIKERLKRIMYGRRGMDEFSRFLFVVWVLCTVISTVLPRWISFPGKLIGSLAGMIGTFAIILCFVRALSRNIAQRNAENTVFLQWFAKQKQKYEAFKGRRSMSKEYRFFKCPNCGTYSRVKKGQGKLRIRCRCGYEMYRKS